MTSQYRMGSNLSSAVIIYNLVIVMNKNKVTDGCWRLSVFRWEVSMFTRQVGLLLLRLLNSSVCPWLAISSQHSSASCELEEKEIP